MFTFDPKPRTLVYEPPTSNPKLKSIIKLLFSITKKKKNQTKQNDRITLVQTSGVSLQYFRYFMFYGYLNILEVFKETTFVLFKTSICKTNVFAPHTDRPNPKYILVKSN